MNPQGQQNSSDQTANFFWMLVLLCLVAAGIWYFHPAWIVDPIYWVRTYEVDAMIFLTRIWIEIANAFHMHVPKITELVQLKTTMLAAMLSPDKVKFGRFAGINALMGEWVRWPTAGILLILGVVTYFRHATVRFNKTHNMQTLKRLEVENWPQIQPVLSLDLVKEDIDKGPWAMARVPLKYCKENELISLKKKDGKNIWVLDKGPAARLFALQIGPLWKDLFNLPIHIKALIVIFVARAERQRDFANKLLAQISASAASGKLDFTGVNEKLIEYQNSKLLNWLRPRHAYVRTMMASLLEIARADGVLATAEFLWLKPVDRKLWYTLSSVGRQTSVVEASGVFAHWKAEKALGRAMTTPMIKEAVKALDACVDEILYIADGDKWRSNEA